MRDYCHGEILVCGGGTKGRVESGGGGSRVEAIKGRDGGEAVEADTEGRQRECAKPSEFSRQCVVDFRGLSARSCDLFIILAPPPQIFFSAPAGYENH